MDQLVEIAFDCLPLRSVSRTDVPLDASPVLRARTEHLEREIEKYGNQNAYFLYNAHCVYHLANSDIEGMLRFSFEGTVLTDRSDAKAERADLVTELVAETCGGVSPPVLAWLKQIVDRAVLIEFDRFIAAGHLARRVGDLGSVDQLASVSGFAGMNL